MNRQHPRLGEPQAELAREIFDLLSRETGEVTQGVARRLRALRDRFPAAFRREHLAYLGELFSRRAADRRVSPRFPKAGTRVSIAEVGGGPGARDALLADQSWQGMQIVCPEPVEVGRVLAVSAADPLDGPSLCLVEVKYCHPREGGWALGCQRVRA
jgi:hypothetical protein